MREGRRWTRNWRKPSAWRLTSCPRARLGTRARLLPAGPVHRKGFQGEGTGHPVPPTPGDASPPPVADVRVHWVLTIHRGLASFGMSSLRSGRSGNKSDYSGRRWAMAGWQNKVWKKQWIIPLLDKNGSFTNYVTKQVHVAGVAPSLRLPMGEFHLGVLSELAEKQRSSANWLFSAIGRQIQRKPSEKRRELFLKHTASSSRFTTRPCASCAIPPPTRPRPTRLTRWPC